LAPRLLWIQADEWHRPASFSKGELAMLMLQCIAISIVLLEFGLACTAIGYVFRIGHH
jgi:hypothetical protein